MDPEMNGENTASAANTAPRRMLMARAAAIMLLIASMAATGLGVRMAAFALALAAWAISARFLAPRSRQDVSFLDRSLVTVALVLAALQVFQMFTRPDLSKWAGKPAPAFSVTTLDGETIDLAEQRGKRVLVDIWATWCPPCRAMIPHLAALREEYSSEDLLILGLSNEPAEKLRAFVQEQGINYPIAAISDLPAPFSFAAVIPTMFVIDEHGTITTISEGYKDLDTLRAYAEARP